MSEDLGKGKDRGEVEEDGYEEAEEHHFGGVDGSIGEDGWYWGVHYRDRDFERRREGEGDNQEESGRLYILRVRHYGDLYARDLMTKRREGRKGEFVTRNLSVRQASRELYQDVCFCSRTKFQRITAAHFSQSCNTIIRYRSPLTRTPSSC